MITFEPRFGTSDQTAIPGIVASESETIVGTVVTDFLSRSITNTDVNAVRITIAFPSLQTFTDRGDIEGASVNLTISRIDGNGTEVTPINDVVTGKTANTYFRDYEYNEAEKLAAKKVISKLDKMNELLKKIDRNKKN